MIICGTGHRPNKLGGYGAAASDRLMLLARDWIICYKPEHVISGGALGWDQALAWACVFTSTPYTLALPFRGFESMWPRESQKKLGELVDTATNVNYICDDGYAAWKMQKRNEAMVDRADQILAMWDGSSGGTANCIRYAEKQNKPIVNLYETWRSKN